MLYLVLTVLLTVLTRQILGIVPAMVTVILLNVF